MTHLLPLDPAGARRDRGWSANPLPAMPTRWSCCRPLPLMITIMLLHLVVTNGDERHLFVIIHGFLGSSHDFRFIGTELMQRYPLAQIVTVKSNEGNTGDGIEAGAMRIFEEIRDQIRNATHLSIIGHSLGGIYGRYLVSILHQRAIIPDKVTPVNFITLATPHMGSRSKLGLLPGKAASIVANVFFGQTMRELLMEDGNAPLMIELSKDTFVAPLKMFRQLVSYACVRHDIIVKYTTAAIRKERTFSRVNAPSGRAPYIIDDDVVDNDHFTPIVTKEDEIFQRLNMLPWKRFAIVPSRPFLAHSDCIVRRSPFDYPHGQVVVAHMIDRLVQINEI